LILVFNHTLNDLYDDNISQHPLTKWCYENIVGSSSSVNPT